MKFLRKELYGIILGVTAITLIGLLIIYLVLAMISLTSGVSQAIGAGSGDGKTVLFNLDAAAGLNLN